MRTTLLATISAVALAGSAAAQDGMAEMTAEMIDTSGAVVGEATFTATPSGMVLIVADVEGIPAGEHGFHIHEVGECDPATGFKSAGGHYAGGMKHGVLVEGGPHPGDLPNITVGEDGMFIAEVFTDQVSVGAEGENPLADADGSSLMIHSGPDDYESQPSGAAGDRIACGVIK